MAEVSVSPAHLHRVSQRVGREWAAARDREVQAFRADTWACAAAAAAPAAAVMLDGGRVQTRAEEAGRGVHEPRWRETKVACCLSLSSQEKSQDPHPEPPSKFLDPARVSPLAAGVKRRSGPARGRTQPPTAPRRRRPKRRPASPKRVRTVVASLAESETFGWQMAAEVHKRGLHRARRKACVCDGQQYNWTLFELHLVPWGFIGILDFVHLLAYLYDAAHAWGKDRAGAGRSTSSGCVGPGRGRSSRSWPACARPPPRWASRPPRRRTPTRGRS